jgi:microcompartment protein CcmK/EutM
MRIGRIVGQITATIKESKLSSFALLVANIEDGQGEILERSVVVADACGAGPGDTVILVAGSAARLPGKVAGAPVDMTAVGVIDHIEFRGKGKDTP